LLDRWPGLILFRRADVKQRNWYCRMKLPQADRYKSVSLKTADIDAAKERAFDQDSDLRFRIKHEVPIFSRPFSRKLPALEGLREVLRQRKATPAEIARYAGEAGIWKVVQPYLEAMTANA
jgi:hypothetical protein